MIRFFSPRKAVAEKYSAIKFDYDTMLQEPRLKHCVPEYAIKHGNIDGGAGAEAAIRQIQGS